jgi:hypothetical protein
MHDINICKIEIKSLRTAFHTNEEMYVDRHWRKLYFINFSCYYSLNFLQKYRGE